VVGESVNKNAPTTATRKRRMKNSLGQTGGKTKTLSKKRGKKGFAKKKAAGRGEKGFYENQKQRGNYNIMVIDRKLNKRGKGSILGCTPGVKTFRDTGEAGAGRRCKGEGQAGRGVRKSRIRNVWKRGRGRLGLG